MDNPPPSPIAGQDYPQTWGQFLDWFATEEGCHRYLQQLRWPTGFCCPQCATLAQHYALSRGRLMCRNCRYQGTVTAGTIFDKTRTPLRVWLAAAWYLTNQKHGVSALGLQRVLGLNSYQTAWTMLHRLRRAIVRPGREALSGTVEVDETYLGISDRYNPPSKANRKSNTTKTLVAIAVEILEPKGFGRIRLRRLSSDSQKQLLAFIGEAVQPASRIRTDGSSSYRPLVEQGYEHERRVIAGSDILAHAAMPAVHRVASLLKRWLLGTHHGAVQPDQLDAYLDEFVFRFNRRNSRSRGLLFYRLLQQAVLTEPLTYRDIVDQPRLLELTP